ncbi:MAG: LPS assembly lipoprotein LptE [Bacteroidota bacterium]
MISFRLFVLTCLLSCCLSSCKYSLGGVSVPPDVKTFLVDDFEITASNAPATINVQFTEALRNQIRDQARLKDAVIDPDIEFRGAVTGYNVSAEAPEQGETVGFNRLTIAVRVEYYSNLNDTEIFSKSFSEFEDFDNTENLLSIQDDLIDDIFENLVDRVFREAFANW